MFKVTQQLETEPGREPGLVLFLLHFSPSECSFMVLHVPKLEYNCLSHSAGFPPQKSLNRVGLLGMVIGSLKWPLVMRCRVESLVSDLVC